MYSVTSEGIEKIEEGDEREAILSQRGITVPIQICSIRSSLEIEIERERGKEGEGMRSKNGLSGQKFPGS